MTSVSQSSIKIDRLSSLPPELLLTIFDLAYDPDHLLLEPLSERLLPYVRRNLYRQIRISSRSSWSKLRRIVEHSPGLGTLAYSLDLSAVYVFPNQGQFEKIVKPFPRLNSVKTGYIQPIQRTSIDTVLPPLEYLSYECDTFSISAIDFLANLKLSTLEINFHYTEVFTQPSPLPRLELMKKLSLIRRDDDDDRVGESIWIRDLAHIIDCCCPKITSLRLYDPRYPDYQDFLSDASSFAPCLTSLELDSPALDDVYNISCDHLLPQFSSLTHLTLGDGTLTAFLPAHLRQLPLLTSLRLGPEAHWNLSASDFFTLLEGPTRHPSLRNLFFGCFGGHTGHRIGIDEEVEEYLGMSEDGWQMPFFHEEFTELDCRNLRRICASNRVLLSGDAT
ncbi:hypothetical protein JCM5353_004921 [Sporobolomyces roseus]